MNLEQIWTNMKPDLVALPGKLLAALAVLLVVTIVSKISHRVIDHTLDNRIMRSERISQHLRLNTMRSIFKSMISYTLYLFALFYIITLFTGPLGLTLSSIAGVAIGFGAQNFIRDIFSGIFIIMEDKFQIGEMIRVSGFQGIVEEIGLRTTVLRDLSGELHSIPNGNIQEITNSSRGNRRFMVDITISGSENINQAIVVMKKTAEEFTASHDHLLEIPEFMGVVNNRDIGTTLRVQGRTDFDHHWNYENELRKNILLDLNEAGIQTGVLQFPEGGMIK